MESEKEVRYTKDEVEMIISSFVGQPPEWIEQQKYREMSEFLWKQEKDFYTYQALMWSDDIKRWWGNNWDFWDRHLVERVLQIDPAECFFTMKFHNGKTIHVKSEEQGKSEYINFQRLTEPEIKYYLKLRNYVLGFGEKSTLKKIINKYVHTLNVGLWKLLNILD